MIFGLTTFTLIHTVLSLVGIFAGFVGTVLSLFLVTQFLVVALFVWLGRAALKGFPAGSATPGAA